MAAEVVKSLDYLIQEAGNIQVTGGKTGKTRYLNWIDATESRLRQHFAETRIADDLLTPRFERIDRDYSYPPPLGFNIALRGEVEKQKSRLIQLRDELQQLMKWSTRAGVIAILDCNVYMHCIMFNEIDWRKEFDEDAVRVVLPIAVIDELDKIKYMERGNRGDRARTVLKVLDGYLDDLQTDGFAPLGAKTTLEIFMDERSHQRTQDADIEIVSRGVLLQQITGAPVLVVSSDRGMRLKAHARGLKPWAVPERLLLPSAK
ncbi:hypothetical protein Aph01nite_32370 [Acrocarpospora phusangensis]|uniref:PIN domain-containing protein n=1 Tax=Acrocarpospora phusangensis TaxID=1070424 RepID=A0A919QER9_9ACTN|nr:hypothetical protein Aph01nite_32370 [Acrocarpospora phusangensis]